MVRLTKVGPADERLVAVERVYRERFGRFVRLAYAIIGDRDLARDAVQEAFVQALRARANLRQTDRVEAWVVQIVVNCAHDIVRRRPAETDAVVADEAGEQVDLGAGVLRAAVARLPERQRLALFLRYYADFDYGQIARVLGIEVGTVSATLHAAHAAVARFLEEVES